MTRHATRTRRPLLLVVATVLVVTACGGDETSDEPATTTASTPDAAAATTTSTTEPAGAPVPELAGTNWRVTDYNLSSGSITNVWPDTEITVRFGSDGMITGFTGCNEYSATYETAGPYDEFEAGVRDANDGQAITFGAPTVTERGCEPDRIMEQEADFLGLLGEAGRWLIARDQLNLRTAEGGFLLEAETGS